MTRHIFEEPLHLKEGSHQVNFSAKNLLNKETKKIIDVQVDRSGPLISISQTEPLIKGELSDICHEMRLFADDIEIPLPKGNFVPFEITPKSSSDAICLLAEDALGNRTYIHVPLTKDNKIVNLSKFLIASNGFMFQNYSKNSPFNVIVDNWTDGQTIYTDNINITGKVFSKADITTVSLDHLDFPHGNGKISFFQRTIPLQIGHNRIVIFVEDALKRQYRRTLHINRKKSRAWQLEHRFCIRANLFKSFKNSILSEIFHKYFWKEMIRRKRFQIQGVENLDNMISKSLHSKISSTQKAASVKGVIHETNEGVEIAARIFLKNSKIIGFVDVDVFEEDNSLASVEAKTKKLALALADRFHQKFPLIDGTIVEIDDDQIWMTPQKGCLKLDRNLISWQVIHYQQRIWEDDRIIGKTRIYGKRRNAFQIFCNPNVRFSVGDRIITQ